VCEFPTDKFNFVNSGDNILSYFCNDPNKKSTGRAADNIDRVRRYL